MKIEGNVKGRRYPVDSAPYPEQPRENGGTRICCICKRELPESEYRDMLELIKAARIHPIVLDPNRMPGGQIVLPLPETVFADRLRAQGIEVPE